jgi:hypothetical protein
MKRNTMQRGWFWTLSALALLLPASALMAGGQGTKDDP